MNREGKAYAGKIPKGSRRSTQSYILFQFQGLETRHLIVLDWIALELGIRDLDAKLCLNVNNQHTRELISPRKT